MTRKQKNNRLDWLDYYILIFVILFVLVLWLLGCGGGSVNPDARRLTESERIMWCNFIDNIQMNLNPIDGIDLEGVECSELPEPMINDISPNCPTSLIACHHSSTGVIDLIEPLSHTMCHEYIHYLHALYGVRPNCNALNNIDDIKKCQHKTELFTIQRDRKLRHLLCEGVVL